MGRGRKQKTLEAKNLKEQQKAKIKKAKRKKPLYETCTKCLKKKPLWYKTEQDADNHENGICKQCLNTSDTTQSD